jgi:hypothetical protein
MICSNQFPYKGMAPAMRDLISGQIAVGFVNITAQVVALHRLAPLGRRRSWARWVRA